MKIVMKFSIGIGIFMIVLLMMAGALAYFYQCPPIDEWADADFYPVVTKPHQTTVAKSSNGTLYALIADPDNPFDYMDLHKSTDGYNWTYVHTFDCSAGSYGIQYAIMKINSTDVLHLFYWDTAISYVVFDLATEANVSVMEDLISDASTNYGASMEINSTDGIRAIFDNATTTSQCLYFFNTSGEGPTGVVEIPGSTNLATASMTIQENDTLYIGAHRSDGNVGFWCWDDGNSTLVDLGTVAVVAGTIHCSDIYVNNTTIAAIAWKISGSLRLIYSDLPTISWVAESRALGDWFFNLNGSRLQLTGTVSGTFSADWNTSYLDGGSWTELCEITPDTGDVTWWPTLSVRDNRFHEPDFWDETLDFKCYVVDFDIFDFGVEVWGQFYPNADPSFLNLTVDATYNELYLSHIDPRDLNPQDNHNLNVILQNTSAEGGWLSYSDGNFSGTSGETGYGNTTVWALLTFDDGTANVSYNFSFTSERIQLIVTTHMSDGYLSIHYSAEIVVLDNVSYYVVTNANWATIDNTTGDVAGYPNSRGVFWFHIYANDTLSNNTDDRNITITIDFHPDDIGGRLNASILPILIASIGAVIVVAAVVYAIVRPMESTFLKIFR